MMEQTRAAPGKKKKKKCSHATFAFLNLPLLVVEWFRDSGVVERRRVMTGCRFDFTVFLFHRPKMELKGFLSFTLLHSFGFNQPQRKQKNKTKQPNKQRGNMLNIVAGTMLCFFLNAPPTAPPLPLCSKCFGSNYLCLNSLHPHLKYQNTWRCFDCLLSPQDLINFFQAIFLFPLKIHKLLVWLCWSLQLKMAGIHPTLRSSQRRLTVLIFILRTSTILIFVIFFTREKKSLSHK